MTEILFVVEEAAEGGYVAQAVGASIFTEADDVATHLKIERSALAAELFGA